MRVTLRFEVDVHSRETRDHCESIQQEADRVEVRIGNSVARDYNHLRSKIASHQSNGGGLSNDAKHILEAKWKPIYRGNYPVKVFYKLPGSEEVVGEYETVINNPVGAQ